MDSPDESVAERQAMVRQREMQSGDRARRLPAVQGTQFVLIAMGLAILTIVGIWWGQGFTAAGVQLCGGGSLIDAGRLPVSNGHQIAFDVENIARRPMSAEEIKSSCQCTEVVPKSFVISGEGRQRVIVTLNLQPSEDNYPMPNEWALEVELLAVVTDHRSVPKVLGSPWMVTGRVYSPVLLDNPRIVFPMGSLVRSGPRVVVTDRSQTASLGFTVVSPLSEFKCRAPEDLDVVLSMPNVVPGRGRVQVTPHSNIQLKTRTRNLVLTGKTHEGNPFDLNVTCVLTAVDDVLVDPQIIVLSRPNAAPLKELRLHSRTRRRFRVDGVTLRGTPIHIVRVHHLTDHTLLVDVELSEITNEIHEAGAETASISVTYLDDPAGTFVVPLSLIKE